MKQILLYFILTSTIIIASCYPDRCVRCDIYDEYGDFVKDYGKFCGEYDQRQDYEEDADWHAYYYYNGWAECY